MNTVLKNSAEQWVGIIEGKIVCHRGIIQFPMRKGWKRGHRMVVLPDYQGIGVGTAFENYTSQYYFEKGWNVNVTTTTPSLVNALKKSKKWRLIRFGRSKSSFSDYAKYGTGSKEGALRIAKALVPSQSNKRITYSFNYIGEKV